MRLYRLQIRVIQMSVLLTLIIMVFGVVQIWQGGAEAQPMEDNTVQNPDGSTSDPSSPATPVIVNTKIVCLGDSFTYGYPGEPEDAWPQLVAGILKIEVINAGKVFQNASDLLRRFDVDVAAKEPGRVIIFAGVGDAIRGISLEEYQKNIKALVEKAEAINIKPILALPIPFPGTDKLHKEYREWEISYAQEKNITILDFREVLFDSEGKIIKEYSDDGKYPNKEGHRVMGEYAAGVLQ